MRAAMLIPFLGVFFSTSPLMSQQEFPDYEVVFEELMELGPTSDGVAAVSDLTITRDVATLHLQSGTIYLLTPVAGRTVAAVFLGDGTLSFAPNNPVEQEQLFRFYETRQVEQQFENLFMMFADGTLEELQQTLTFGAGSPPNDVRNLIEHSLKYLSDKDSDRFDTRMMMTFLNRQENGLFYAHVSEDRNKPFFFQIDPFSSESILFGHRAKEARRKETREIINQFSSLQNSGETPDPPGRRDLIRVGSYRIESTIERNMDFSAEAEVALDWVKQGTSWFPLSLYYDLEMDEVEWGNGEPATYFKGEENPYLWIRMDQPEPGDEPLEIVLRYHGDFVVNYPDEHWFLTATPTGWYPWDADGTVAETPFDVTFHTPERVVLVGLGDKVEESIDGRMTSTRWVTPRSFEENSFSLGDYDAYPLQPDGIPPLTVLVTRIPYRPLPRSGLSMQAQVGADVANSLRFFQEKFGPLLDGHIYAAEILGGHGQAFAGMVHLSYATFFGERDAGADQVFRAHEIAHQWWGVGVDGKTYHDKWLTEGISQFAALWYLDAMLNNREVCIEMLEEWRKEIFDRGDEAGPMWLGTRVASSEHPGDYQLIVYNKGAFVLHMLRGLLGDEKITNVLREFYMAYRGSAATTEEFQNVVEEHTGEDMDWFFNQWVYGNDLPTYSYSHRVDASPEGGFTVRVRVAQEGVPVDFRMSVPVRVEFDDGSYADFPILVSGALTEAELPRVDAEPKKIILNPDEAILAEVKTGRWPEN